MKIVILLSVLFLIACSDFEKTNNSNQAEVQTQATVIEFQPVSTQQPVQKIDITDDEAIIKSAGVPIKKIIDSVDTVGEPKKIYQFADSVFGTQIELSRSQILLAWIAVNEDESSRAKSLASIAIAQKLARAMFGIEGGKLVDEITIQGKIDPQNLDGHQVTMGTCVSGLCSLKIGR